MACIIFPIKPLYGEFPIVFPIIYYISKSARASHPSYRGPNSSTRCGGQSPSPTTNEVRMTGPAIEVVDEVAAGLGHMTRASERSDRDYYPLALTQEP